MRPPSLVSCSLKIPHSPALKGAGELNISERRLPQADPPSCSALSLEIDPHGGDSRDLTRGVGPVPVPSRVIVQAADSGPQR